MSTVILCNGNYAKNPYCFEADEVRFFSIEEVCYFLYKNAFLLPDDFFSDSLLDWIRDELDLPAFADSLLGFREKEDTVLRSIEYLFEATGYYGEQEFQKVRTVMQEGSKLSVTERRKLRADAYCRKQKYLLALGEYEELLKLADKEQTGFVAKLYHNIGVCHAGMFLYEQAAESFQKAFEWYPNTESYVQFLTALKFGSTQAEYLSYLSGNPESYEDSLEVEERIKRAQELWEDIAPKDRIERMTEQDGITSYAAVKQLLKQMKEEYLTMANKG